MSRLAKNVPANDLYYEKLALDSSFDEAHKRQAVIQMNEEKKGYKVKTQQGRKHSVAGSGGTSSQ